MLPSLLLIIAWHGAGAGTEAESRGHGPLVAVAYTAVAEASFESSPANAKLESRESRLSLDLFRRGDDRGGIRLGFDYQYTRYAYEGVEGRDRDLHRLQLPLMLDAEYGAWHTRAQIAPGVSTSSNVFKDLVDRAGDDDVLITVRLEARRRAAAKHTHWLAGFAYDRAFGRARTYPIAGVVYEPAASLALRLALPDSELRYRPSERQRLTVRIAPAGHEWHVVSEELAGDFDYRVRAMRLQGVWSVELLRSVWLDFAAGYEFARHHRFTDDFGQRIDSDIDAAVFAGIGFRFGDAPIPFTHESRH